MTTEQELDESFDRLAETALRVKKDRDDLLQACKEVRDLIDGYIDIKDGLAGQPTPNDAMRAATLLDLVIRRAEAA